MAGDGEDVITIKFGKNEELKNGEIKGRFFLKYFLFLERENDEKMLQNSENEGIKEKVKLFDFFMSPDLGWVCGVTHKYTKLFCIFHNTF